MANGNKNGSQDKPIVVEEGSKKKKFKNGVKKFRKKRKDRVHVDLSSFDEVNDPVLARELAEIALSGRSFSSGYSRDIEHGKKRIVRDEGDRWRNPIFNTSGPKRKLSEAEKKKLCLVGILVLVITALIGVVCGFFLNDRQKTIDNIISRVTDRNVLQNKSSPQYQARNWMLKEDDEDYELEEDRVIQRYALATFFFGTGGYENWYNSNWLFGDECAEGEEWHGLDCNELGQVRTLVSGKFY